MNNRSVLLALLALLLSGCDSLGARAPNGVDLTGIWDLDAANSDNPSVLLSGMRHREHGSHRRFGEMREARVPHGPGGIGQGPGGGFPLGRAAGGGGFAAGRMGGGTLGELNVHELDIEQRSDSTRIEYDRKDTRIYRWGEHKSKRDPGEPASGWSRGKFVIRAEGGRGRDVERTFTLSQDGAALTVVTTAGKLSMKQHYEKNQAATATVYGSTP